MSPFSAVASTRGSRRRRATSSVADRLGRGRGRSSATGVPSLVMVSVSPLWTRASTSPPWLRMSRTETLLWSGVAVIPSSYHP